MAMRLREELPRHREGLREPRSTSRLHPRHHGDTINVSSGPAMTGPLNFVSPSK